MANVPLVTIFIPTFNRANFLTNAIESALEQTWKDLQVIVCDNASSDNTAQVVAEFAKKDSRVRYVRHAKNIGMLNNYEYCLANVESKYFSFLSDDDTIMPKFCESALSGFSQYPDIAFFANSTVSHSAEQGIICIPLNHWEREGRFTPEEGLPEMIGKYPIPTTVLFHQKVVEKAKIDFENPVAWDCDFLIQVAGQFPFAISKEHCGIFFHHPESFSGSQSPITSIKSIRRLIFRAQNYPWMDETVKGIVIKRLKMTIYHNSLARIIADIAIGNRKSARKICLYLISTGLVKPKIIFYFIIASLPYLSKVFIKRKHWPRFYRHFLKKVSISAYFK